MHAILVLPMQAGPRWEGPFANEEEAELWADKNIDRSKVAYVVSEITPKEVA